MFAPVTIGYQKRVWRIAASVLLVLTAATWFWFHNRNISPAPVVQQPGKITPGKNGGTLTLADGSTIVLENLGNGVIATQNGIKIVLKNGELTYLPTGSGNAGMLYNTMTVPRKRRFRILLPDGSKVWLNAESSIRYPAYFTGPQRKVEVTGEAYFEVAKKAGQPFMVTINKKTSLEVLGTHFNIKAYDNEPTMRTTLVEGSVKITHADSQVVLKAGQQAQVGKSGQIVVADHIDTRKDIAWKDGTFYFEGLHLDELMRELERWYDIEVIYEDGIPEMELSGEISMDISLDNLMNVLGEVGVHYRIEGSTLTILP